MLPYFTLHFFYTYIFCNYLQDLVQYHYLCIQVSFPPFLGSLSQFFHPECVSIALKN